MAMYATEGSGVLFAPHVAACWRVVGIQVTEAIDKMIYNDITDAGERLATHVLPHLTLPGEDHADRQLPRCPVG